jgi:hypothetical protein
MHRLRLLPLGLAALAGSLIATGSAQASLLTASATNCGSPALTQAFSQWGDNSSYELAPGGNFADTSSWKFSRGATVVAGGDGYSLGGAAPSTSALSLPDGSSATSAPVCVGINDPTARFMAENSGASNTSLLVSATVTTSLGISLTLPVADLTAGSTWSPSPTILFLENLLPLLPGNYTPVTFTFAPQGTGGAWQIDDLYVDPFGRGG